MNYNFPTVCIDDFYPNPNEVREFALKQEYKSSENGTWPGMRTKHIHEIDQDFFDFFCKRVMNVFYNYENEQVEWNISSNFQLFPPYNGNVHSSLNTGLIHRDLALAAGIIYLTPNPNPDSGTSIFHPKKGKLPTQLEHDLRFDLHTNKPVDEEAYSKMMQENDDKFEESITFKNRFNRLIMYDAGNYHKANSYIHNDEPRLIQVFFINNMRTDGLPLHRWRHWS